MWAFVFPHNLMKLVFCLSYFLSFFVKQAESTVISVDFCEMLVLFSLSTSFEQSQILGKLGKLLNYSLVLV